MNCSEKKLPKLKLTYFNIKGRAESIRVAFKIGKVPFEDLRIQFGDWKALKPTTPFGALPILTVGSGQDQWILAQSNAILKYAGKLAGLYPVEAKSAAQVDQMLAAVEGLRSKISRTVHMKDEKKKMEMRKELGETTIPDALKKWSALVNKSGWYCGNALTIADLKVWELLSWITSGILDGIPKTILKDLPLLKTLMAETLKLIPEA